MMLHEVKAAEVDSKVLTSRPMACAAPACTKARLSYPRPLPGMSTRLPGEQFDSRMFSL